MSKPAHTVKLRNGAAPAEHVTTAQLDAMKAVFGTRFSEYEVTAIEDEAPKPAAVKVEKSKSAD
ncbi:hypothetical protein BEN47_06100 [Hymenobacter lapidarius]|uniref:Uncharacterized protein n=1 Tax=Hymenobacter lapidarius TaxID=1908237 RepID=A0A1G1SQC9_9BACT|nr:hypothetical protein [Hymenobacter lapidarius]OGX80826.1 hypothetical protein BEN47_06100 [Hymenobacter lapidarius]